jgi:hypothetical protein
MAAVHGEAALRQRACVAPDCQAIFFICAHCDRGHRYCSATCREHNRRGQQRRANSRHQRSEEGRLDHRDRQREYRQRCQSTAAGVTDQGSLLIATPAPLTRGQAPAILTAPLQSSVPVWSSPRCRICGRVLRFVNPFPRIPPRR